MPPSMKPQLATWPSPMSPTEWCISTYAVPGASGPAHVPMMPLTAMNPFISGDSNHRSSSSVALIVNSRVTSATVASSTCERSFHASLPRSHRSAGFFEPTWGGVSISMRPEDVGDARDPPVELEVGVGVALGDLRDRLSGLAVVLGLDDRTAASHRHVPLAQGEELEAEPLELQLAPERRRHQAHRVAERVDLDAGILVGPRLARVGRPAGLVALLEHERARATLGQERGGDEAVVAAADHDRVVPVPLLLRHIESPFKRVGAAYTGLAGGGNRSCGVRAIGVNPPAGVATIMAGP